MKFSVVPESSERCTAVIARSGSVDAVVQRGDRRVVPVGDRAGEDAGDGGGVEVERVDALDVERDGDRRDVGRELDEVGPVGARVERAGGDLLVA